MRLQTFFRYVFSSRDVYIWEKLKMLYNGGVLGMGGYKKSRRKGFFTFVFCLLICLLFSPRKEGSWASHSLEIIQCLKVPILGSSLQRLWLFRTPSRAMLWCWQCVLTSLFSLSSAFSSSSSQLNIQLFWYCGHLPIEHAYRYYW